MSPAPTVQAPPLRGLVCGRCGTAFDCGSAQSSGSCWCMDETYRLPVPDPAAGDCLCPGCLRSAAKAMNGNSA